MPLVVSRKSKKVTYIENEDFLSEILGHSDFDGHDWAVGDLLVFEDGTGALVERDPREFHVWSNPHPLKIADVIAEVQSFGDARVEGLAPESSWRALFAKLSVDLPRASIWKRLFGRR
jgi:hypothetical protein